jgi:steroid delta-isomerase-like uncharacterized protein
MNDTTSIINGIYSAINSGDLHLLEQFVSPDWVDHGEGQHGREAFQRQIAMFRSAFPDLKVTVDEVIVDGDRFASRTTVTGTHTGELMGMPPSGRQISVAAVDFGRIEDGRAKERWGGLDTYSLLVQLGAVAAPSGA